MLYWKRRDAKVPLDEVAASDNSETGAGTGGGVSLEIDQSYNSGSTNAQSGTAVAQAVSRLETQITTKYGDSLRYKGTVANEQALPQNGQNQKGDVYNVTDTGANFAWDGTRWDKLSENLEGFAKQTDYESLNTSFTQHKQNKDENLKHVTDTDLQKLTSIEIFTQEKIKESITEKLQEKIETGDLVTKDALQADLEKIETDVQSTVTQTITDTLSGSYVPTADFEKFKADHENDLTGFLKCEQADELKVYTKGGEAAPPLSQREERVIYLVGEGATVSEETSPSSVVASD